MGHTLLVTMVGASCAQTFSFDDSAEMVLWLGPEGRAAPKNAWACLEKRDRCVVVRPLGAARVSLAGRAPRADRWIRIDDGTSAMLRVANDAHGQGAELYLRPSSKGMRSYRRMALTSDAELVIGRDEHCEIVYESRFASLRHARLLFRSGSFFVEDLRSGNATLVNDRPIAPLNPYGLLPGDVVRILDMVLMVGVGFVCVNHPPEVRFPACLRPTDVTSRPLPLSDSPAAGDDLPPTFYPSPRIAHTIHPLALGVEAPPEQVASEEKPAILQIGPSFLMGMSSLFMAANAVAGVLDGGSVLSALPASMLAVGMVGGCVLWPLLSRRYERRQREREEALRKGRYVAYLDGVEDHLSHEASTQEKILRERYCTVRALLECAATQDALLMSHAPTQEGFMDLRVGRGDRALQAEISWPRRQFSVAEDVLWDRLDMLRDNPPGLRDVPLSIDLVARHAVGVVGGRTLAWEFVRGLLVQACAYYSYRDVKVALIVEERDRKEWDPLSTLAHVTSLDGRSRNLALTARGMDRIGKRLQRELEAREDVGDGKDVFSPHVLVVCANGRLAESSPIVDRLMHEGAGRGFSVLFLAEHVQELPRECEFIVDLSPDAASGLMLGQVQDASSDGSRQRLACMFERSDASGTAVRFDPDVMVTREQTRRFALDVAKVRLDVRDKSELLPATLGFVEMFRVGSVEHLNVGKCWLNNDSSRSLRAPVGVDARGKALYVDLHEGAQGPHALIAGTTGSGKSEFISTLVLSLCVSYAPDEVSFVFIDYKGGGLARAFDNERLRLPHLAGTITNLDGSEIHRALVSLQSELRRRQSVLNDARARTGEATMDIHDYLALRRQGILHDPLPHLVIIADEFAELKQQEPDFMDELISAARIGRSLGVHLVLATQKPTGVVNDQIWSNARLKVCLKVADAADSREMIRTDDAAAIVEPGRLYYLVGYNEAYAGGQSAYAGMPYRPRERFEPRRDLSVDLMDEEGVVVESARRQHGEMRRAQSEFNAVLEHVIHVARERDVLASPLWLAALPHRLLLEELVLKYGAIPKDGLVCVAGELDDPANQRQKRFEVDLERAGNALLYGGPGSGVDDLACTMLASLVRTHDSGSLWVYVVDHGDGQLMAARCLPQVGGVVGSADGERLGNLLHWLETELARRREDGASGARRPRIVVFLMNLTAWCESYPDDEDRLVAITRDGPQLGVHVVAVAQGAVGVHTRLRASFGVEIPVMLNDATDYLTLFGSVGPLVAPHVEGRGLVVVDKSVLEFQVACARGVEESVADVFEGLASSEEGGARRAPSIPVLPASVTCVDMGRAPAGTSIPVGLLKMEIEPVFLRLGRGDVALALGGGDRTLDSYLEGLLLWAEETRSNWRFVDLKTNARETPRPLVVASVDEAEGLVRALTCGESKLDLVVFVDIVHAFEHLSQAASDELKSLVVRGPEADAPAMVLATQSWKLSSNYEDWLRVASSAQTGVWAGGGFSEQTWFRFSRSRPEYRASPVREDGFVIERGAIRDVRLLVGAGSDRRGVRDGEGVLS